MDNDMVEVKERLVKIETLLQVNIANLEARVKKLEETNIWLTRAVIIEVIGIISAFIFNK